MTGSKLRKKTPTSSENLIPAERTALRGLQAGRTQLAQLPSGRQKTEIRPMGRESKFHRVRQVVKTPPETGGGAASSLPGHREVLVQSPLYRCERKKTGRPAALVCGLPLSGPANVPVTTIAVEARAVGFGTRDSGAPEPGDRLCGVLVYGDGGISGFSLGGVRHYPLQIPVSVVHRLPLLGEDGVRTRTSASQSAGHYSQSAKDPASSARFMCETELRPRRNGKAG